MKAAPDKSLLSIWEELNPPMPPAPWPAQPPWSPPVLPALLLFRRSLGWVAPDAILPVFTFVAHQDARRKCGEFPLPRSGDKLGMGMHDAGSLDLAGVGIAGRFDQPSPLFLGQVIFGNHGHLYVINFGDQLLACILQRHFMGAAGVAGEDDEVFQAVGVEGADNIFEKGFEGGGGNGDGSRMAGRGAAAPIMDRRGNKEGDEFCSPFANFICLDGVGGKGQVIAMLLNGTEGDVDRLGPFQSLFKVPHRHIFDDHVKTPITDR